MTAMDQFEFTRLYCERPQRFAWFLGAGASRNANLPTAEDIINDLKRCHYCSEEGQEYSTKDMQNDAVHMQVQSYFDARGFPERWSPEEYSTYFEIAFGEDRERQRQYLSAMLAEERVQLAVGNRVLGALIADGKARAVFTTNFDTVVEKAVAKLSGTSISAFHLDGAHNASAAIDNEEYPVYCKLHGDFRYDSLKNLSDDLAEQNEALSRALTNAANRFGFIVVGYSGRDESVMKLFRDTLETTNPFPHGLYWAIMKGSEPPKPVADLIAQAQAKGVTASTIELETYDTFMLRLWRNLPAKSDKLDKGVRRGRSSAVCIPVSEPGTQKPIIRYNGLPILETPNQCYRVNLKIPPTWKSISETFGEDRPEFIFTLDDELIVIGEVSEIEETFGDQVTSIESTTFDPNWTTNGRMQIKRFVEDAAGRCFAASCPLLLRRNRSGLHLIIDNGTRDVGGLEKLQQVCGKLWGTIPGLSVPETDWHDAAEKVDFAEALQFSLSIVEGQMWLLLRPDVWIWPPFARRYAVDWLDQRKKDRRNDVFDELLSAWVSVLLDDPDKGATVQISLHDGDASPSNPCFLLSSRTGYSLKEVRR